MVEYFVTPSIIHQFVLKPEWGLRSYYQTLEGVSSSSNFLTDFGSNLHSTLGYNNTRRFYKVAVLELEKEVCEVAIEGTPDKLHPLEELKTCSITDQKLEEKIYAAMIQLLGYMFLTNQTFGYVVFADRKSKEIFLKLYIERNDDLFLNHVRDFLNTLSSVR